MRNKIDYSAEEDVSHWAYSAYGATPTAVAPPAPAPAPSPAPTTTSNVNVGNWYQTVLGRQGDQAGIDYWQNAINSGMDAGEAYKMFVSSATANNEQTVKPVSSWEQANAAPSIPAPITPASLGQITSNPLYTPHSSTSTVPWNPPAAPAPVATPAPTPAPTQAPAPAPAAPTPAPTQAPAPAPVTMPAPVKTAVPAVDVANWYRTVLGRDGDAAGIKFWQDAVNRGDRDAASIYADFVKSANVNQEATKQTAWEQANSYTGPASSNPDSVVDEWGINVLGRPLTAAEMARWDSLAKTATTPAQFQAVYAQFVAENANQLKNQLSAAQASQITAPPPTPAPTPAPAPSTPAPAPAPTPAPTPAPVKQPVPAYVNVSAWYLNQLGRLPTASETSFWQTALENGSTPEAVYAQFTEQARKNGETVTPVAWAQANTYRPNGSSAGSIVQPAAPAVDWAKLQEQIKAPEIDWSKLAVQQIDWSKLPQLEEVDWSKLTPEITLPTLPEVVIPELNPTQIKTQDLAVRDVKANETVNGQLQMLLAENSPVLQQQRAEAMRAAADRGMINSALASSGADDAMTRAATTIAVQDAGTFGKAADYNTTANNQAIMWNADTAAQAERLQAQLKDSAATRQQQLYTAQMNEATERQRTAQQLAIAKMQDNTQRAQYAQQMAQAQIQDQTNRAQLAQQLAIAQMQDATARAQAAQQLAIAQMQDATNRANQSNQMTIAQMQDATSRFQSELTSATSRYNTDANYKQQMDSQRNSLANNIIQNMEMSPDRKAAMLESLGLGTSASRNPDGSIKYGTGLAGAVYVIGSTTSDLQFG